MDLTVEAHVEMIHETGVAGKKVTVIGAARSGVAVAELLQTHGARVFVSDSASREKLASSLPQLESFGVEYEIGQHTEHALDADLIVLSPGVPSTIPIVVQALQRAIPLVSELELASWFCPAPMIAVTGTNGKTTTTALLGSMFHDAKRNYVVGGNIGTAFSSL